MLEYKALEITSLVKGSKFLVILSGRKIIGRLYEACGRMLGGFSL